MRQARTLHANLRQPNDSISILPLGGKNQHFPGYYDSIMKAKSYY